MRRPEPLRTPPGLASAIQVGAVAIARAEVDAEVDRLAPLRYHTRVGAEQRRALLHDAVRGLVERALVLQDAQARGLQASDDELQAEFARTLQQAGPEYRDLLPAPRAALFEQFRGRVVRRVLLDKNEARFLASLPPVDEAALRERFAAAGDTLRAPRRVHLQHLLIKVEPTASAAEVATAAQQAAAARAEIVGGAAFADVAKRVSADIYAQQGGDLGFVEQGALRYREVEAAAFALQPGELSAVLSSLYGFHVLRCVEVAGGERLDFAAAQERLRHELEAERAVAARRQWFTELLTRFPLRIDDAALRDSFAATDLTGPPR